ncbi:thioredoxin domain-containing protein [Sphingobacterium corticibacterium]|uniref:Thioredoxin domain-containing protein n=1 Tax=Sphingobacterium corticibacterium TaxID=2484746 RepID=A0A4Q6XE92_9SPHI|nr:thioredoxin domain-containing protein [Sphingobacterium corticibacterium]RZF58140.1 thioredoxin domain-containing protein [Sphingobacterium corticibacterium]
MANQLLYENSPYLKQHAHNPVDWMPWGEEALQKAKNENKLIIVSIGYSACHWCHVMERESFENEAIAKTMNTLYVSVKIDREERPDIDQIYMIAVQLMTNTGGWPLNCICLPDGRPIYGGTYFKPHDWQQILLQIAQMWEETPDVALDYAERLSKGIHQAEKLPIVPIPEAYTTTDLHAIVTPWKAQFDATNGGYSREPKFPLPNNWLFFLRYAFLAKDQAVLEHVHFTLEKIANGGIYDQVGGGFARYAVDGRWHIPHFEKMLYDNGQLISLYSEAYQQRPSRLYERIVEETIAWAQREMLAENGGFYSALDADSEGVEGKFYTFHHEELENILGKDAPLFIDYFHVTKAGNWPEESTNVLYCAIDGDKMMLKSGFSEDEWEKYLRKIKVKLHAYREKRIRPGLDNKQLTSWNALFVKGLVDAYRVFGKQQYLDLAIQTANFIRRDCFSDETSLLHQPADHNRKIFGFLDDYAFTIDSFISLYEATFDEDWLYEAEGLTQEAVGMFYDEEEKTFFYTADDAEELIARKSEIMDNVIPASSSAIVRVLYRLGEIFDQERYIAIADQVFANVFPQIKQYGSAYSNWAIQLLEHVYGNNTIALTGKEAGAWRKQLDKHYIPNKITLGGTKSDLPLLKDKAGMESKSYLCKNKACSLPQNSVAELLALIHDNRDSSQIN